MVIYIILSLLMIVVYPASYEMEVQAASEEYIVGNEDRMLHNPVTEDGVTTWDCIYFGNYWQSDTNGDGVADKNDAREPIKWRVLAVDGNDAFLLADKILDSKQYNDKDYKDKNGNGEYEDDELVTWEDSEIREWLNNDFYQNAFSESEQAAVMDTLNSNEGEESTSLSFPEGEDSVDKVYLASKSEMRNPNYGMESDFLGDTKRATTSTAYAKLIHSEMGGDSCDINSWWLRAPRGYHINENGRPDWAAYFESANVPLDFYIGIRPVMHLDLSKATWGKAESVSISDTLREAYSYTVDNEEWKLSLLDNGECYIQIGKKEAKRLFYDSRKIGLSSDGVIWIIDTNDEIRWYKYDEGDGWAYASNLYKITEDGLDANPVVNVSELIYDENNYIIGYKLSDGTKEDILSYEEMKKLEKKPSDVAILHKIIQEQKALGATIEEDLDEYTWNNAGRLSAIYWSDTGLKGAISLEGLTALESVHCSNNQLTSLDVSQNPRLEYLECENNSLEKLDLPGDSSLREINCSNNKLSELDLSKNIALEELNCSNNSLISLDLSNNAALEELSCGGDISSLDVSKNPLLKDISLSGDVDVKGHYCQPTHYESPNFGGLVPKYYFNFDFSLNGGYGVTRKGIYTMPEKKEDSLIHYVEGKHGTALNTDSDFAPGVELPVSNLGNSYTISFWYNGKIASYYPILFAGTDILSETNEKYLKITQSGDGWLNGYASPTVMSCSQNGTEYQTPWYAYNNEEGKILGDGDDSNAMAINGEWVYITLTVDDSQTAEYGTEGEEGYVCSSKATTYINGKFFGTGTVVRDIFSKDAKTFLAIDTMCAIGGCYDDLAFFDQAITAEQAKQIYECAADENKIFSSIPLNVTIHPSVSEKNNVNNITNKNQQPTTANPNTAAQVKKPTKVSKVKVSVKKKKTTVSWKKVKGAKGYQVQYALNKKFTKKKKIKLVKKNKITIKGLKKKVYYIRVRAYKKVNGKKVYGKWSKVKKVRIKK